MMVADLFVVDDLFCVAGDFAGHTEVGGGLASQVRQARLHILGQIPAVGAGVSHQLLFIESLGVIEGLLRRIAQQPVGIPLESCQVIEGGRTFCFLLSFVFLQDCLAGFPALFQQRLGLGLRTPNKTEKRSKRQQG